MTTSCDDDDPFGLCGGYVSRPQAHSVSRRYSPSSCSSSKRRQPQSPLVLPATSSRPKSGSSNQSPPVGPPHSWTWNRSKSTMTATMLARLTPKLIRRNYIFPAQPPPPPTIAGASNENKPRTLSESEMKPLPAPNGKPMLIRTKSFIFDVLDWRKNGCVFFFFCNLG